ncbi:hypothetical protein [Novosphingopyxis iocasae]|uniref:hypothetical protein n=1 Tax=Novosphingopyxis iocasae TaxID=2762729 RepID=UPI0016519C0D|nr:hypothetical protein [Novosphingopyxis iocasae]
MGEAKSFASLSSGLLARKGAAKPAMRRPVPTSHPSAFDHDDLGWNDMGYDVDPDPEAETGDDGRYRHNPLMGAIPDTDPASRARIAEQSERLNAHALPSDEELEEAASKLEADHPLNGHSFGLAEDEDAAPTVETEPEPEEQPRSILAVKPRAVEPEAAPLPAPKPSPKPASPKKAKIAAKDKTAFTLRLDQERHLKLRLACAVRNVSAQKLVTGALDDLLAGMPELGDMARHMPSRSS